MSAFEQDLRDHLRAADLPPAPLSLRRTLADVVAEPPTPTRRAQRGPLLLLTATLAVGGTLFVVASGQQPHETYPSPPATAIGEPAPPSPLPSQRLGRSWPITPPLTVSELLEGRAAGDLVSGIWLQGYWSGIGFGHSCVPPDEPPGELEIWCHDGEYGITERPEPVMTVDGSGRATVAEGPLITPWATEEVLRSLGEAYGTDPELAAYRLSVPVPVIVIGHFDDPRAADCRPQARRLCLDRFVIDEFAQVDVDTVPAIPTPTPFPFDNPPAVKFTAEECWAVHDQRGEPDLSFYGWMSGFKLTQLTGSIEYARVPALFVGITRTAVPRSDWSALGSDATRLMARSICIAGEGDEPEMMEFGMVLGSDYRERRDGSRVGG